MAKVSVARGRESTSKVKKSKKPKKAVRKSRK